MLVYFEVFQICFTIFSCDQVILKTPVEDWFMLGGIANFDDDKVIKEDDGKTFFYQKW